MNNYKSNYTTAALTGKNPSLNGAIHDIIIPLDLGFSRYMMLSLPQIINERISFLKSKLIMMRTSQK